MVTWRRYLQGRAPVQADSAKNGDEHGVGLALGMYLCGLALVLLIAHILASIYLDVGPQVPLGSRL